MNKHIVICSNILWSIPTFRKYLIKALLAKGCNISVVGSNEGFSDNTISKLNELKVKTYIVPVDRSSGNIFKNLIYIISLIRVFKTIKPDIVMLYSVKPNIFGSFACRVLRIPFINTINGLGSSLIDNNMISFFVKNLYRFSLKKSNMVLFQNLDDREFFIKNKIVKAEIASYVPGSGIDTNEYSLPTKTFTGKRTFLLVGRLLKDKGVYEFIEAIREIKKENISNVEFLLGGIIDPYNPSAITINEVESWEKLGLIHYIGMTDHIEEFFSQADFIVSPSYREGLSRLLIEAASCRKAIITTNVPGCRDIVQDSVNGFICEPRDSESLKKALLKGINTSNSDLELFGKNSREIVIARFDESIVNKIYLDILENILK